VAAECQRWLGWLDVADRLAEDREQLDELRQDVADAGFVDAVLAGMGGSSLCPDVLRATFGRSGSGPDLRVLDSTDPSTIAAVEHAIDLERTLFLIASKSGGTLETLSHYRYFWNRVEGAEPADGGVGARFLAITDDGSALRQSAEEHDFGWIFLNPEDIGGRYSALSYFGMVPATVMGLDVAGLLGRAVAMGERCRETDPAANPGLLLGAVLGAAAVAGRDKVTIVCSPAIATFGMWLEQLLAESTGKQGKGIVPVESEPLGGPASYGADRLFVHLRVPGDGTPTSAGASRAGAGAGAGTAGIALSTSDQDAALDRLRDAGHPVLTIELAGTLDLGGEFLRWEVATAVAGAMLEINPFDQPNVQESKDNTKALLQRLAETGDFGVDAGPGTPDQAAGLVDTLGPGDYFAILAYTQPGPEIDALLERIRLAVRDRHGVATTAGYGPRYLHSTGQLHKGGPNSGAYLILGDERGHDLPIPGERFGFKTLIAAQWAGDLKSLRDHGRRVALVRLGEDREATLGGVLAAVGG
jgi:glucose-6-phosphate isomerase/transaldolase/glucose-6-phosphate isomerase